MTDLQAGAFPRETFGRSSGQARAHRVWRAWLRRFRPSRRAEPIILRQIAPTPATGAGWPTLGDISAAIAHAALGRQVGLMNAYVASAVEVALEAEALHDGVAPSWAQTPVHHLVSETVDALRPCAKAVGAVLAHDRDSRWSASALTDPGRVRKVLKHLILRALSGAAEPGLLVRVMVTLEPGATRVTVLTARGGVAGGLFDLAASVRLLQGIGAALEVEPARAGCTAVSIVLSGPAREPARGFGERRQAVGGWR